MKKIISVLFAFLICVNSFLITALPVFAQTDNTETVLDWRDDFLWGQNMHNSKRGYDSPDKYSEEALYYAAKQGVKLIRYQGQYIEDDFSETDRFIGLCNKYGIKVMLCVWPNFGVDEPTQDDLDYVTMYTKAFAERYNGKNGRAKVDYFQLWNEEEIGMMRAKYGATATSGDLTSNYFTISVEGSEDLVEWTKNYKAAVKGIREADTDAKIVINFSSRAFGCVRYYQEQGVDFDYIGWDWYAKGTTEQAETAFYEVINGWKDDYDNWHDGLRTVFPDKDLIICESGMDMNYIDDIKNIDYTPFLGILDDIYSISWIKGLCAFKLTESPSHPQAAEKAHGHIDVEPGGKIIAPKQLYYDYQYLIGGDNSIEKLQKSSIDLKPYEALKVYTQDDSHLEIDNNLSSDNSASNGSIDGHLSNETTSSSDLSKTEETPIIETVEIKPEDIYNKTTTTITHNKMPWILIISVGVGMLVLFGAGFATFILIKRKKGL